MTEPAALPAEDLDPGILDLTGRVVLVPVRHHSPACARVVRELARRLKPKAILIEGPSDFNDRMGELRLPHRLPIAIYSFFRLPDGSRRGAYYPFCVYSPEWQAVLAAAELGVPARFIDLPWSAMAGEEVPTQRYADGELRFNDCVSELCRRLGVDDFDALWDTLFEVDPDLSVEEYLERCHRFCHQARALDRHVSPVDVQREAFMADQIRAALAKLSGPLLVVTGGFHSPALWERLRSPSSDLPPRPPSLPSSQQRSPSGKGETANGDGDEDRSPVSEEAEPLEVRPSREGSECGISLTPYSYERLDSLTGYESGMPSPGFYHQLWEHREQGRTDTYRRLLEDVVKELRARGQSFSTADLIAVEATARGLASLRAHPEVWRTDLVDGILGALVKDELALGVPHPFLEAVHAVLRGGERGRLAEGTELPPLVHDIRRLLEEHELTPEMRERTLELELLTPADRERGEILHRLRVLGIPGFQRTGGTDLVARTDLSRLWERWTVRWTPAFEAGCIEAALYGPTLLEAAAARLAERAAGFDRSAEEAALLLLDACLMGLAAESGELVTRLVERVRADGSFFQVTGALDHLLFLFRYDEALGAAGVPEIGALLREAWERSLWLLEMLGRTEGQDRELLRGISAVVRTFEVCGAALGLNRDELVAVLARSAGDRGQSPVMRGAATGALWVLGESSVETVAAGIRLSSEPSALGDYLTGLFALARETVQRHHELVTGIDEQLLALSDEQFLEALPALRLAFSFFTPREKHYLARTLLEATGGNTAKALPPLQVGPEVAARALSLESRLWGTIERYGLHWILAEESAHEPGAGGS